VFFSGGIGSFFTTKRVIQTHGKEDVILLFTDTLIEDDDLYRFMDDAEKFFDVPVTKIADGRTPWEVFKDVRWLGNSRLAQCSHILKQKTAEKWIKANFQPNECILYLGIDWSEEHRTKAPTRNWEPYKVEFPMCEEPFLSKDEMIQYLETVGIEIPKLYKLGFSHNNCSGMCVRAGQGHFINLLKQLPERYLELEEVEKEMQRYLEKDVTILKRTKNKVRENLSLEQLRLEYQANQMEQIDMFDIGGCGCFVDSD
jgi:3'-phosphoadenosine 5'-phosphosulfate sulfotransferase (PAPS reductase)/FAD synthetase